MYINYVRCTRSEELYGGSVSFFPLHRCFLNAAVPSRSTDPYFQKKNDKTRSDTILDRTSNFSRSSIHHGSCLIVPVTLSHGADFDLQRRVIGGPITNHPFECG